ncbi:MAG: transcription elongation factor subunit Spt4 [Nanoarchaeota archaeon]|jgi:DNA-directed RNA polymerase subunit E"
MVKKAKACRKCRFIFEDGEKCPKCGSNSLTENWKGKIEIVNPETSEVAKQLKLMEKGVYAVKID